MTVAWWTSLLLNWMPFFILIAAWIVVYLIMTIIRRRAPANNRLVELVEVQIMEMQRTNALLDRIAVAQEKRAEAPLQNAN
jgi:flagellar biosynthesis/type III secretory pathway M-ring protein FliF/YscJ